MPKKFTSQQQDIIRTIRDTVKNPVPDEVFYTPEEWKERREQYGTDSLLVVCHDGGDHAPFFNLDYEAYARWEEMIAALRPLGVYSEQCTSWYSAIYRPSMSPDNITNGRKTR